MIEIQKILFRDIDFDIDDSLGIGGQFELAISGDHTDGFQIPDCIIIYSHTEVNLLIRVRVLIVDLHREHVWARFRDVNQRSVRQSNPAQ